MSTFTSLWSNIKYEITNIQALGPKFLAQKEEYVRLLPFAVEVENVKLMEEIRVGMNKADSNYATWKTVNGYIVRWLPSWLQAEQNYAGEPQHPLSTIGIAPVIILGVAGLAALSYTVVYGLKLLKDYTYQKNILNRVTNKVLSVNQGAKLIKAGTTDSLLSVFTYTFTKIMAAGIIGYILITYSSKRHKLT